MHDEWLSGTDCKDLTPSQLGEKNSITHVCASQLISGRLAALFVNIPPRLGLNLRYKKLSNISLPQSASEKMQGEKDKWK